MLNIRRVSQHVACCLSPSPPQGNVNLSKNSFISWKPVQNVILHAVFMTSSIWRIYFSGQSCALCSNSNVCIQLKKKVLVSVVPRTDFQDAYNRRPLFRLEMIEGV